MRCARFAVVALVLSGVACYRSAVTGRFRDQPVVERIDDQRPIPEPSKRVFYDTLYVANVLLLRPLVQFLDPPSGGPALDINAMEEVPDSSWFENRIGRAMTAAQAARGPDQIGPPEGPYVVVGSKTGGNPGFVVSDRRGVRYLLKFDTPANPEQQTGTNAIVSRLFWALGYHVPVEHVLQFRRSELQLPVGTSNPLDDAAIDRILAQTTRHADGSYRASASQLLDGVPKGGWTTSGVRGDDPNDRVPHQRRRVLRGLRLFAAWLGHTDLKEDNTLSVYVGTPGKRYLRHYLIDFGEAFGGHQSEKGQLQIGWEYAWDYVSQLKALLAFGLWKRAWESQEPTPWPSVGHFAADHFDPRTWKERLPYLPFQRMDRADAFWAARLIMRFDRPLLEAVVATGQLSEPAAARHLVDTLLARRAKIGAVYLDGVTPLEEITLRDGQLCAVDVSRAYGVRRDGVLVVAAKSYPIGSDGKVCVPVSIAPGYQIVPVQIRHARGSTPALELHCMGGASPRLLGIVR